MVIGTTSGIGAAVARARGTLRAGSSVLDREPEEANLARTVPSAIGPLTRNEQGSGSSPLVGTSFL
jgi:hypothetical protein